MQIIKWSKECKWIGECRSCGCVFVYQGSDIERREIIDEEMVEVFSRKAECEPPRKTVTVVMCPECHEEMTVPKMACYRKPAIGIRDEDYEV